jgi:hypothetical protein
VLHRPRPSAGRPFTQACNKIVTAAARCGQSVLHLDAVLALKAREDQAARMRPRSFWARR